MTSADQGRDPAKRGLWTKIIAETKAFLGIFLYLFVVFGFFVLARAVIQRKSGVDLAAHGFAAINAAVCGKVILIGEQFQSGKWVGRTPLFLAILLESLFFTLLLIVFHFSEEAVVASLRGSPAFELDAGGGGWLGLALVAIMVFVGLIPFFAYRNFARVIGPERMRAILFGPANSV